MSHPIEQNPQGQVAEKQRYIAHARALVNVHGVPDYCYTNPHLRWALVATEWRNGRWQKRTISARHGGFIAPNPKCGERDIAVALRAFEDSHHAVGIAQLWPREADIVCIDGDHALDPFDEWNDRIIDLINLSGKSDAEISISGHGVHIFVQDDDAANVWRNRGPRCLTNGQRIEVYSHSRMICRTFNRFPGSSGTLQNGFAVLSEIEGDISDTADRDTLSAAGLPSTMEEVPYRRMRNEIEISDHDIVAILRRAGNREKFRALFDRCDLTAYGRGNLPEDHSRADQSLACMIAFYAQNAIQIERIFGMSALGQREKWVSRADYRIRTVAFAIQMNDRAKS